MVAVANAVIRKWAVMIESVDAPVAVVTMVRFFWSNDLALRTQISRLEVFIKFQERNCLGFLNVSRVFAASPNVAHIGKQEQTQQRIQVLVEVTERHHHEQEHKNRS